MFFPSGFRQCSTCPSSRHHHGCHLLAQWKQSGAECSLDASKPGIQSGKVCRCSRQYQYSPETVESLHCTMHSLTHVPSFLRNSRHFSTCMYLRDFQRLFFAPLVFPVFGFNTSTLENDPENVKYVRLSPHCLIFDKLQRVIKLYFFFRVVRLQFTMKVGKVFKVSTQIQIQCWTTQKKKHL